MSILRVFRIERLQMGEDGDDLQVAFQDGVADIVADGMAFRDGQRRFHENVKIDVIAA
jgi:hypothetical protein